MMASDTPSNPELHGRSTISDIQNALLLAFLNEFRELEEPDDRGEPPLFVFRIAESVGIKISKTVLKLCIDDLAQNGLITVGEKFEDSSPEFFFCHLTAKGYRRAEQIERQSDAVNAADLVTSPDTPPQASTALSSTTFGFSADSAPFGSGTFNSGPLNTMPLNGPTPSRPTPASDRYVSVKDNQKSFDEISAALTLVKNEFAEDHFKQLNSINSPAIVGEIEAFERQIESGWVSRPAAKNFLETIKYIEDVLRSLAAITESVMKIIKNLALIGCAIALIFG